MFIVFQELKEWWLHNLEPFPWSVSSLLPWKGSCLKQRQTFAPCYTHFLNVAMATCKTHSSLQRTHIVHYAGFITFHYQILKTSFYVEWRISARAEISVGLGMTNINPCPSLWSPGTGAPKRKDWIEFRMILLPHFLVPITLQAEASWSHYIPEGE